MNTPETPRTTRDRDVRLTRRLRAGMVSAGVLGSFGVAGMVGYAAVHAGQAGSTAVPTSQGNGTTSPQSSGQTSQQFLGEGDDGGEQGDDGGGQLANPFSNQAPPQLQQGFGSLPQGQTSGS